MTDKNLAYNGPKQTRIPYTDIPWKKGEVTHIGEVRVWNVVIDNVVQMYCRWSSNDGGFVLEGMKDFRGMYYPHRGYKSEVPNDIANLMLQAENRVRDMVASGSLTEMSIDLVKHADIKPSCAVCGSKTGIAKRKNGVWQLYCECGKWHSTPKIKDIGVKPRKVYRRKTIGLSQRTRIILRAAGACELCRTNKELRVGHMLSVKDGVEMGLTAEFLNSDENIAAMCECCNSGIKEGTIPLRVMGAILMARQRVFYSHRPMPDDVEGKRYMVWGKKPKKK